MAAPTVPKPGGSKLLAPGSKRKRMLLAIAAGGALALIFLLQSRADVGAAAADTNTGAASTDPFADAGAMPPTTFADNGQQAADLGNSVSDSLGGFADQLSGSLSDVTDALAQIPTADQIAAAIGQQAAQTPAPSPQLANNGNPAGSPTSPGFHPGHSKGHEYYVPGVGWVSQARFQAWQRGGTVPRTSTPTKPTPPPPTSTGGSQQPRSGPSGTAPGFHPGHSAGHDYYIPGFGWVSQQRYQHWRQTGVAK